MRKGERNVVGDSFPCPSSGASHCGIWVDVGGLDDRSSCLRSWGRATSTQLRETTEGPVRRDGGSGHEAEVHLDL